MDASRAAAMITGVMLAASAAGCTRELRQIPIPWEGALLAVERSLGELPIRYADARPSEHFNPTGTYTEGTTTWVFSNRHPRQIGIAGSTGAVVGRRTGPAGTQRCVPLRSGSLCVGQAEPRGLRAFGVPLGTPDLPDRAGYADVAVLGDRIAVLDAVDHRLRVLDSTGHALGAATVPPAPYRMGPLGPDHVWVLSGVAPFLSVVPLGAGTPAAAVPVTGRRAPSRDAVYDPRADRLWLVGPANGSVRRDHGPIRNLYTVVTALSGAAARGGRAEVAERFDLRPEGLVDGAAIALTADRVVVAATGSDRLFNAPLGPRGGARGGMPSGGLGPVALEPLGQAVLVVNRLDDSVARVGPKGVLWRARLDRRPRRTLRDLGERLFYGALLYQHQPGARFTCNSCHWDGRTDHRSQPGFLERRREVTRSLAGIGAVAPIFTTGGAPSATRAIEGLFRGLDPRLFDPAHSSEAYWDYPIAVPAKGGGSVILPAATAREALLRFLMDRPVARGPMRPRGRGFTVDARAGWPLFRRDCAACHEPSRSMRTRQQPPDVLSYLASAPLTFGSPAFARTGALPYFTPAGNRIPPLLDLGRGGPFLASGAAPTLVDLLNQCRPHTEAVHSGAGPAHYSPAQVAQLRAFLLSL